MTYKTIVVHCEAGPRADARLAVAADVAQRCGAHLIGVYAREPFAFASVAAGGVALAPLIEAYENACESAEKMALSAFERATGGSHFPCDWHMFEGFAYDALAVMGLYADLLVVGQVSVDEANAMRRGLPQTMAFGIGRPVLMVPSGQAPPTFGRTVLLCWNFGRGGVRAATDALPLLQAAQEVIALEVIPHASSRRHGPGIAVDLSTWLARHRVRISTLGNLASETQVNDAILSYAADQGADLIVAGCEGPLAPWRTTLSGTECTPLANATIPILMAN